MDTSAVALNIVYKLQEKEIDTRDAARQLNVTNETFSRWIRGARMPTAYALYRMAQMFDCTMEELMEGCEGKNA